MGFVRSGGQHAVHSMLEVGLWPIEAGQVPEEGAMLEDQDEVSEPARRMVEA